MQNPKLVATATDSLLIVLDRVTPADLDRPTPCEGWSVRDLLNHLTHWNAVVSPRSARKLPRPDTEVEQEYLTRPDWQDHLRSGLRDAAEAWSEPQAWQGETTMTRGPIPAAQVGSMAFGELVAHGWDLARAIDAPFPVTPEVVDAFTAYVAGMAPMAREHGVFGAEVPVGEGATALDRALAAAGRDPGWRAG
ncbi:TIGR03086 family metal-binding protein [Actinokineospora bangkokensis]|uniref:TIGR03086 family protein n=1 Tax=Actinokineospora bangkokensis TaxID=1193682 RepID=A0A1Q9LTX8_9PSEU|nr:TIGR03086 family metal-binding protein [Actinokineospora bangkokensis]OLR95459.1 TIGR03086 family protein [Actinokineospora bangkokensis]